MLQKKFFERKRDGKLAIVCPDEYAETEKDQLFDCPGEDVLFICSVRLAI